MVASGTVSYAGSAMEMTRRCRSEVAQAWLVAPFNTDGNALSMRGSPKLSCPTYLQPLAWTQPVLVCLLC
jgi:hypothetical protein